MRAVEAKLGGSNRLQLNIFTINGSIILNKEAMKCLEKFQKKLELNPFIANPVSVEVNIKQFLEKRTPVLFQSNVSENKLKSSLSKVDVEYNSFFKLFSEDISTAGFTMTLMEGRTSELNNVLDDIKIAFESSFDTSKHNPNKWVCCGFCTIKSFYS